MMKKILVLALVGIVAMLAVPTVVGNPDNNPNGNPPTIASFLIIDFIGYPDGPGFSEDDQFISSFAQGEVIPGFGGEDLRGLSILIPGYN